MSKIKITQKQADAIEDVLETHNRDRVLDLHVIKNVSCWEDEWKSLNDLLPHQLARALYIGYEVEPEFKTGDWVTDPSGDIGITTNVNGTSILADWKSGSTAWAHKEDLSYSTPEEITTEKTRRWWSDNGRGVWELQHLDLIVNNDSHIYEVETRAGVIYLRSTRNGSAEVYDSELEGNFIVVCFAEDRQDLSL